MSKLDELLDECRDATCMECSTGINHEQARAELAALRRRAEDVLALLRYAGTSSAHVYQTEDGLRWWVGGHLCGSDPATGLPILNDEARKAMQ